MPYRIPDSWRQARLSYERAVFRFDPVPGTGKKNWSFGDYYRTADCLQERKLYGDLDHRRYSRGKRYPCNLPDSWDDRTKSRYYNKKSWKKVKKKKQWMKREDNMISFSPGDNRVQMDATDSPKKFNIDVSETKASDKDRTRPSTKASQTVDDDLRGDFVEERYEEFTDQKNPYKTDGQPGRRIHEDPYTDTGLPPEGIKVFEEDTPVVVDDSKKHGPHLKWQFRRDPKGKTGPG